MYRSLERDCPSFHLTAFCFDEVAEQMLSRLALEHLTGGLPGASWKPTTPACSRSSPTAPPVEYCWTATPALPLFMLETRPELDEITYLDADLLFFADPEPAVRGDGVRLRDDHPAPLLPEYADHEKNGIYNVQFMTFRRDERGLRALRWWHDRCIEWCYCRLEDGKLGDQKYLDDWPERFQGVHVLQHKGGGLAPWNASQYRLRDRGGRIFVDEQPLVFFHYHRVRMRRDDKHDWHPRPPRPAADPEDRLPALPAGARGGARRDSGRRAGLRPGDRRAPDDPGADRYRPDSGRRGAETAGPVAPARAPAPAPCLGSAGQGS